MDFGEIEDLVLDMKSFCTVSFHWFALCNAKSRILVGCNHPLATNGSSMGICAYVMTGVGMDRLKKKRAY